MFRLRDFTPRGLHARSMLMLLLPLALILGLTTWYYFNNHIAEVNRKLGQGIARDVTLVQAYCDSNDQASETGNWLANQMDLVFDCDRPAPSNFEGQSTRFAYAAGLRSELETALQSPVTLAMDNRNATIDIYFPSESSRVFVQVERKRALSINAHIFIVWLVLTTLITTALAIAFMNQQVRTILRLSDAARDFGRGRDVPDFAPSGAREVREAASSVIDMKNRLTSFAEQRTAMLAGVSHDLRTPLTRLKLTLAMMDPTEDIGAAQSDLDEMAKMLDEYLAFARGEEEDEMISVNISKIAQSVAGSFDPPIVVKGASNVKVTGRPLALKRAISNLVSNATIYGTTAELTITDGPDTVDIHIDDNGPGIPADRVEEAMRPFSRLDKARSQNTSGTGLGLSLARDTATAHGGNLLLVESPLGGLRATLRLPH